MTKTDTHRERQAARESWEETDRHRLTKEFSRLGYRNKITTKPPLSNMGGILQCVSQLEKQWKGEVMLKKAS